MSLPRGIPEAFIVLLSRVDEEPFAMKPQLNVKINGIALEVGALIGRFAQNDFVLFYP